MVQELNCAVQTTQRGRSERSITRVKEENWTVIRDESRRSKRLEVDGPKNGWSNEKQLEDQQG